MSFALVLLLAGCFAVPAEPAPDDDATEAVEATPNLPVSALDSEDYAFCHLAGADAEAALQYCPLLEGAPVDRCVGLRETCAGAAALEPTGCESISSSQGGWGATPGQVGGAPGAPTTFHERVESSCDAPDTPSAAALSLTRWVMAIVVAGVLLVFLRFLIVYLRQQRPPDEAEAVVVSAPAQEPEGALPDVPDLPSADLLAAAKRAYEAGDYGLSVALARGASLRALGGAGALRLHRSKTDREYTSELRSNPKDQAALREVVAAAAAHKWGGVPLSEVVASAVLGAASTLVRVGLALILLWPSVAAAQSRHGPNGDAALYSVLELWGVQPRWRLRGLGSIDHSTQVLVLDSYFVELQAEHWDALRQWVESGGVLWLAGGSEAFSELGELVELERGVPTALSEDLSGLRWGGLPDGATAGWLPNRGLEVSPVVWISAESDRGELAIVQSIDVGEGVVFAVSEPSILWNGSFVNPANEAFVGDALNIAQSSLGWPTHVPIQVELATAAGSTDPTPPEALANSKLLAFVLQLMVSWGLLGVSIGAAFGPLRDPPQVGRVAFASHLRALGTRWLRAGATRHALAAYASLWLSRLGPRAIAKAASDSGMSPEQAAGFVSQLEGVVAQPAAPNSPSDLDLVSKLWKILNK